MSLDEIPDGSVIPSWEDETEFVRNMRESSPGFKGFVIQIESKHPKEGAYIVCEANTYQNQAP